MIFSFLHDLCNLYEYVFDCVIINQPLCYRKANHYNNYYKNALTIGCAVSLILGSAAILLLKLPEPTDVSSGKNNEFLMPT